MAEPKKKKVETDPYASLPNTATPQDPYASLPDTSPPMPGRGFPPGTISAAPTPGTYKMRRDGKLFDVEFGNVESADKLGFQIELGDALRYLKDKTYSDKTKRNNKYIRPLLNALPTIGGLAGGAFAVAGSAPTAVGMLAAAPLGAAAGGMGGEDLRQMGMEYFFNEGPKTVKESAREIGKQGLIQGTSELLARGAGMALTPAIKYYGDTARAAAQRGYRVLPSEARGVAAGTLETYPKGSMFTAGKMAAWRQMQNTETEAAARRIADAVSAQSLTASGSRKQAGDVIREGIEQHTKNFRTLEDFLYGQIDKKAKGAVASRSEIVAFAKQVLAEIKQAQRAGGASDVSEFTKKMQAIVKNKAKTAPFSAMKLARRGWLAEGRQANQLLSGPEQGIMKKMAGLADKSMIDAAANSGVPGLVDDVRDANQLVRDEHLRFEQKLVQKIVDKKNPEAIAAVLRGNPTSLANQIGIDETKAAMEIMPKELIPKVQKQILLDSIDEAKDAGTGDFSERKFAKSILQIGDERGAVLFGKNWKNISEFSKLLNRITGTVGKSGAAAFANPQVLKEIPRFITEAVVGTAGSGVVSRNPIMAAAGGIAPVAGEFLLWKTVAAGLTHPATAERLLQMLQKYAVRTGVYLPGAAYNENRGQKPNETWDELKKKSEDLLNPQPAPAPAPLAVPAAPAPEPAPAPASDLPDPGDAGDGGDGEPQASTAKPKDLMAMASALQDSFYQSGYAPRPAPSTGASRQQIKSDAEQRRPAGQPVSVSAPDGSVHVFQNQAAADQFKAAAGIP